MWADGGRPSTAPTRLTVDASEARGAVADKGPREVPAGASVSAGLCTARVCLCRDRTRGCRPRPRGPRTDPHGLYVGSTWALHLPLHGLLHKAPRPGLFLHFTTLPGSPGALTPHPGPGPPWAGVSVSGPGTLRRHEGCTGQASPPYASSEHGRASGAWPGLSEPHLLCPPGLGLQQMRGEGRRSACLS